jgi:hypothetical protein
MWQLPHSGTWRKGHSVHVQGSTHVHSVCRHPHDNSTYQTFLCSRNCACPCYCIGSTPALLCQATGAGPRHVGALGRLIIWRPFKEIFFQIFFFGLGQGWQNFFEGTPQILDNFWKKTFVYGNTSLLPPYFQLFQWCLSARYRLAPWAADSLTRPLVQPCM